ncbi:hypothetical protein Tco_0712016 [Tanacetum coccineum]
MVKVRFVALASLRLFYELNVYACLLGWEWNADIKGRGLGELWEGWMSQLTSCQKTGIGGSPLKLLYPRLYLLETSPSCKVMERCNNANGPKTRSWAWRRPISGGLEATQFNDLLVLLEGFNVVDKPDTWECNLNPTKVFTVLALRRNIESYTLLSLEDNIL